MRARHKILLVWLMPLLLLTGCHRSQSASAPPKPISVVTMVHVSCVHDSSTISRQYTQERNMQFVLNYLRLLPFQGSADTDPERVLGDEYRITLQLSDGRIRVYRQRAGRYLSIDCHPWYQTDPEKASSLLPFLQETPSD